MAKEAKSFNFNSYSGFAFFGVLFVLIGGFIVRSANAIVYLGQSYNGWGAGSFYWNDLVNFYYSYPGWIDFVVFFMIFTSLGKLVFHGEKFRGTGNAGKALSFALGLTLSLGLVLWQAKNGINLLEHSAILVFLLLTLGIIGGVYYLLSKKWGVAGGVAIFIALLVAYLVWLLLSSYTGLGMGHLFGYMGSGFGGFGFGSFGVIINLILAIGVAILLLRLIGSIVGWGRKSKDGDGSLSGNGAPGKFWRGARKGGEWLAKKGVKGLAGASKLGWKGMKALGRGAREGYADLIQSAISYVNQIIQTRRKCVEILKDVNARIGGLSGEMMNYLDQQEGKEIHKQLEEVANLFTGILRATSSPKNTLNGYINAEAQYSQVYKRLQRILKDLKGISELKGFCKALEKTAGNGQSYFNKLKRLSESLAIIVGKSDVTIDEIMQLIEQNKKDIKQLTLAEADRTIPDNVNGKSAAPAEVTKDSPQEEDKKQITRDRSINDLKQKYIAYVFEIFRFKKNPETAEERVAFKRYIDQRLKALFTIVEMAEKQGCSMDKFLSKDILNRNMQTPRDYYNSIYKRHGWPTR